MAACSNATAAATTRPSARRSNSSTPAASEEVAELLALHFGRSDEAEKSIDYAIQAAEKSQRRWANSRRAQLFR